MIPSQILTIYKDSIIRDTGKQNIAAGTTFDDIRTAALLRVRAAILNDAIRELEYKVPKTGEDNAFYVAIEVLRLLKEER